MSADGKTAGAAMNRVQELTRQFRRATGESTTTQSSPPMSSIPAPSKLPKVLHQIPKVPAAAVSPRRSGNGGADVSTSNGGTNNNSSEPLTPDGVVLRRRPSSPQLTESPVAQRKEAEQEDSPNRTEQVGHNENADVLSVSSVSSTDVSGCEVGGGDEPASQPPSTSENHETNQNQQNQQTVKETATVERQEEEPQKKVAIYQPSISSDAIIGLEYLQEQVRKLALRKGFTLNVMVIGRSGLGKSTLINTLFQSTVLARHGINESSKEADIRWDGSPAKTTQIRTTQTAILENGVKLDLSVTDTPGFGDQIDNSNCWEPALKYIDDQYEKYLREEQSAHRMRYIQDTRIHCCLYFLPPNGHGLRALDLEALKRLHNVVNVIPVIAKSDTMTVEERAEFKRTIQEELRQHRIGIYPLAQYEHEEDYNVNQTYRTLSPFCVVGSEKAYEVKGRKVLGRLNRWGLVEVENPQHCEFHHLRNLLIRNRMQDLIELTSAIHYESFRRRRLMELDADSLMNSSIDISALNESHI